MKKILLIIAGSVASYKSMDLVRLLKKANYEVFCVLTKSAQEFITPLLATSLSGNKTYNELFDVDDEINMGHINLSRQVDLVVVAPATANFIAKISQGLADDLASTTILASNKPILVAPAMNEKMWSHKSTQDNLQKLKQNNVKIIEPQTDILACGEFGIGKMAEPQIIFEQIESFFNRQNLLKGKNILITAGATFEPIDLVRFIGNRSSGTQAIKIAEILKEIGANITFISANIKQEIPLKKEQIIEVATTDEMFLAVKNNLKEIDCFIGCAAVSDFKVKNPSLKKIKKDKTQNGQDGLILELVENVDILEFVGNLPKNNRPKIVIGFGAESENLETYGKEKLLRKNCDLILVNNIDDGKIFGSQNSDAILIEKDKIMQIGEVSKSEVAKILAEKISEKLKIDCHGL